MLPGWDIAVDVTPAALEAAFARAAQSGTPAKAALVVSPTYFGTTSDIPGVKLSCASHLVCHCSGTLCGSASFVRA
jgi:arginine/lysine/ornithine decarboxylase